METNQAIVQVLKKYMFCFVFLSALTSKFKNLKVKDNGNEEELGTIPGVFITISHLFVNNNKVKTKFKLNIFAISKLAL